MNWLKAHWRTIAGVVLSLLAIGVILLLAFLTGGEKPPSRSTNLLIAVVAAAFQLAAGWIFASSGRVDPAHVQASARRLMVLGWQTAVVKKGAQRAFEADPKLTPTQFHAQMGMLSAQLSFLEEDVVSSIDDWRLIHELAVEQAEGRKNNGN